MADRMFFREHQSLEIGVTELFCKITVGAAGAVSASSGAGITSVTKESSAGQYTILLADAYNSLLGAEVTLLHTTDSDPATVAVAARIKSEAVATAAAPTVVIQGYAYDDGAVANFASGAILYVRLTLKNSSVS